MEFKGYRNCAKTKTSTGYTCTSSINAKIKETTKNKTEAKIFFKTWPALLGNM